MRMTENTQRIYVVLRHVKFEALMIAYVSLVACLKQRILRCEMK